MSGPDLENTAMGNNAISGTHVLWDPSNSSQIDPALCRAVEDLLRQHPTGILPIVKAGHPVLRAVTTPYQGQLGDLLPDLLEYMRRTMLDAPGVGLAANQIGLGLALAVVWDPGTDDPDDPRERVAVPHRTILNPRYEAVAAPDSGEVEGRAFYEGCLSVPGYQAVVNRARAVRLIGQDEHGEPLDEVLVGWPARIVQHETDHLGGMLYLDRADLRSLAATE